MSREQQVYATLLKNFLIENGRMPNTTEIEKMVEATTTFAPTTSPMVPLDGATSNAEFVTDTLKDLIKDRDDIKELILELSAKADRIKKSTQREVDALTKKANNILTAYKDNDFRTVINDVATVPDSGDVYRYYTMGPGYAESADTSAYYMEEDIELNSFNITGGKEGVRLKKAALSYLTTDFSIKPYTDGDAITLNNISTDPIQLIATGNVSDNKGAQIEFDVLPGTEVATIEIDTEPITASVIVDGTEIVKKSLDGKTIVVVGKTVEESLIVRLFSTESRVSIVLYNIKVTKSSSGSGYVPGRLVTLPLDIPSTYGDLLFKPDQYVPSGTSINWYYSPDRVNWRQIEVGSDGEYLPIDWNSSNQVGAILKSAESGDKQKISELSSDPQNVKVVAGRDAILFATKDLLGYNAFVTHVTTTDGYTGTLTNPVLRDGTLLFESISINSDTYNYNEAASEINTLEFPAGTHRLEIVLNENLDFSAYDFKDSGILDVLLNSYFVEVDLSFPEDYAGRVPTITIQPYGLTETSLVQYKHSAPSVKLDSFYLTDDNEVYVRTPQPCNLFDIILLDTYTGTEETAAVLEEHIYAGAGGSTTFTLNHLPNSDLVNVQNLGSVSPSGDEVTITVDGTSTEKTEELSFDLPEISTNVYEMEEEPLATPVLGNDNVSAVLSAGIITEITISTDPATYEEGAEIDIIFTDEEVISSPDTEVIVRVVVDSVDASDHIDEFHWYVEGNVKNIINDEYTKVLDSGISFEIIVESAETVVLTEDVGEDNGLTPIIGSPNNKEVLVSGLPDTTTYLYHYTEAVSMSEQGDIINLELQHPCFNNIPGYIDFSINGETFVGSILKIQNNIVQLDLSEYSGQSLNIVISYFSYEHDIPYKFEVIYDYYANASYFFSYQYLRDVSLKALQTQEHYDSYYDISYYVSEGVCYITPAGESTVEPVYDEGYLSEEECLNNGGEWHTALFLKAELNTDGENTPLIRRIRFDRQ